MVSHFRYPFPFESKSQLAILSSQLRVSTTNLTLAQLYLCFTHTSIHMYCIQTFTQTSNESLHFLFHSFIHRHQSSTGGNDGVSGSGLGVVTALTQDHLDGGGGYGHRGSAVR